MARSPAPGMLARGSLQPDVALKDGWRRTRGVSRNAPNIGLVPAAAQEVRPPPPPPDSSPRAATARCTPGPLRGLSPPVARRHRRINYLSTRRLSKEFISEERQRWRGHGAARLNYSSPASSFHLLPDCRPLCSANLQQGQLSASIPSPVLAQIVNKPDENLLQKGVRLTLLDAVFMFTKVR